MNTLLQATAMSFGERAAYAGKMVLIGMLVIFASLATLWLVLVLFRRFLERGSGEEDTPAPPAPAPKAVPAPVPVAQAQDDAIVAAITAAVAAALAAENGGVTPAFRVVSYRRIGK